MHLNDVDFRKLIAAETSAVYRLACHLTHSPSEGEDLVQETYLRALRSAGTFTLASFGARPWLFKILHNVILSRGAKQQRERAAIEELRHTAAPPVEPNPPAEAGAINWDDVDQRLKCAIADLPLPYREAFLLSVVEVLKYREIAEVTEVPVGTVMSRLSRARALLATRLASLAEEHGMKRSSRMATELKDEN